MSLRYKGAVISATPPTLVAGAGASGAWTLQQQMQAIASGYWPVNGPFYIEDVFSTYLYTGNGSTQTITNGIDLSGKGGLVWQKTRNQAFNHALYDTARGTSGGFGLGLISNSTSAQVTGSGNYLTTFNSNGFTTSANGSTSNDNWVSWTFRKQPKFFDVVTYTGNGAARTISHNLGSTPGCIIIKCLNDTFDWIVWHRSFAANNYNAFLNTTDAAGAYGVSSSTAPTSTVFSLTTSPYTNSNGKTYVAYLFAHNAGGFGLTGTDNVISCGSYTGTGAAGNTITLGYEPQWVMIKQTDSTSNWYIIDTMRGFPVDSADARLFANTSGAEDVSTIGNPTATGFSLDTTGFPNASGSTYIYIAIRRGPMKTPTSGTSVFNASTSSSTTANITSGFVTDFALALDRAGGGSGYGRNAYSRLQGDFRSMNTTMTDGESTFTNSSTISFGQNNGIKLNGGSVYSSGWVYEQFQRAPGFFDVVCYTGNGSQVTLNHNLAVAPELVIFKCRSTAATDWVVYRSTATNKRLDLNSSNAEVNEGAFGTFTATTMTLNVDGNINSATSGRTYVAYLFATVAGVSKVGSYTGSGTTKQIDCGFTGGARFVLIKRTDSTGDWYVWDSARGIVAGSDPYLTLNTTAAEVTTTDWVDTYSAGFELSNAGGNNVNINGAAYIFLSVA